MNSDKLPDQDPHGGLGPLLPGWQPQPAVEDTLPGAAADWGPGISSAAPSTVGDFDGDDFSTVEVGSEPGIHRLPDFKSMLEAALRGDVVRPSILPLCTSCYYAQRCSLHCPCKPCRGCMHDHL